MSVRAVALRLGVAVLAVVAVTPASGYQRPTSTVRVSEASDGTEANAASPSTSGGVAMTPDGRYVAFSSDATNLAPGVLPASVEVYVHDTHTGTTILASVMPAVSGNAAKAPPCLRATEPAISSTGRYVAFRGTCSATALPNVAEQIYVHDVTSNVTRLVSVDTRGMPANLTAREPSISANGQRIAFSSTATNLTNAKTCSTGAIAPCATAQIYVHDVPSRTTKLVSATPDGTAANGTAQGGPAISLDGKFVAFTTTANNLSDDDDNVCNAVGYGFPSCPDVYLHNIRTGHNELISVQLPGQLSTERSGQSGHAEVQSISADDRYVYFRSRNIGLVPQTPAAYEGAYVRDRKLGRTERVTVDDAGQPVATGDGGGALSPDGRYTVFGPVSRALVASSCTDPKQHSVHVLVLHDQSTGQMDMVGGVDYQGRQVRCGESSLSYPQLSSSGRFVAFASSADYLVQGDRNEAGDVFVLDRGTALGVGGLVGAGKLTVPGATTFASGGVLNAADAGSDVDAAMTTLGANLRGASMVYRPSRSDLFVRLRLQRMPMFELLSPALVYGAQFSIRGVRYQVRAAKTGLGSSFSLFRATHAGWQRVSDLRGGIGTTGEEVVFSIPLGAVGGAHGGELRNVTGYTGVGAFATGTARVIDRVRLA